VVSSAVRDVLDSVNAPTSTGKATSVTRTATSRGPEGVPTYQDGKAFPARDIADVTELAEPDDDAVTAVRLYSENPAAEPEPGASGVTPPDVPTDLNLPAVASVAPDSAHRLPPQQRAQKTPSADEIRQRYGDLPLTMGGKRISGRPSESPRGTRGPQQTQPLFTAATNATPGVDQDTVDLPIVKAPSTVPARAPDAHVHSELPRVGIGRTATGEAKPDVPAQVRPRRPPAVPVSGAAPPTQATRSGAPDPVVPRSIRAVVPETSSQPPSTGRPSTRTADRSASVSEAELPIPHLPAIDDSGESDLSERSRTPRRVTTSAKPTGPDRPAPPQRMAQVPSRPPAERVSPSGGRFEDPATAYPSSRPEQAATPPVVDRKHIPASQTPPNERLRPAMAGIAPAASVGADLAEGVPENYKSPIDSDRPHLVPGRRPAAGVPLLIDVTPLSLCVETVGGYCDMIVDRNTPVPCERSRQFVTAHDGQQTVRIRVGQGESRSFSDNLVLGELELTGLRAAPRGQLRISVTFGLDTDGILHVRAIDLDTGRAATSELRLAGMPSLNETAQMAARQRSAMYRDSNRG
jgi:hypothetical protein